MYNAGNFIFFLISILRHIYTNQQVRPSILGSDIYTRLDSVLTMNMCLRLCSEGGGMDNMAK